MKKIILGLLCLLLLVSCAGNSPKKEESETKTIEVTGKGQQEGLKVKVTFKGNKIENVEVVEHKESQGISDAAIAEMPKRIVEANSVNIDTIAGATNTSKGIIEAVKQAIEKAGLKFDDFNKKVESKTSGKEVNLEADIVIIGGGIAGLSATLQAQLSGAKKVILLEKMPMVGGSTMMSGGLILGAESSVQKKLNLTETNKDLADYLYKISEEKADRQLLDKVASESGKNIDWLIELGVKFKSELYKHHSTHPFTFGHTVDGFNTPSGGGTGITKILEEKIRENKGEILVNTPATELIVEDNKVVGVRATNSQKDKIAIKAKKVIIATGGFGANKEMMSEKHPYLKQYYHGGNKGNTGDGIKMAEALKAKTLFHDSGIDLGLNNHTYYGYGEEYKGLLVTDKGKRFMDESLFHFTRTRILIDLGVNQIWAITDQSNERVETALKEKSAFKAKSLEELAKLIQVDEKVLVASVNRYNELAKAQKDADFKKDKQFLKEVKGPEYIALRYDMGSSGTIGGLVINEFGQVINESNQVIENLYAAGEVASGQFMYKEYPGSGTALCIYLAMGRIAGEHAAQAIK